MADRYIENYKNCAKSVVFCSVVSRTKPRGMSAANFRHLANQFDRRLRDRAKHIPHVHYFPHDRLSRFIADDGVHLNDVGKLRFSMSLRSAILLGLRNVT